MSSRILSLAQKASFVSLCFIQTLSISSAGNTKSEKKNKKIIIQVLKLIIQVNAYDTISSIQFWTRIEASSYSEHVKVLLLQEHSDQCLYSLQFSLQFNKAFIYERRHEKTCLWGFRQGPTQTIQPQKMATGLKILDFGSKGLVLSMKQKKMLISCVVTLQLVWTFVFAYAKSRFSHDPVLMVKSPC